MMSPSAPAWPSWRSRAPGTGIASWLARRGPSFATFLPSTSLVSFAAILSGRQLLDLRELPWTLLAAAVRTIIVLRWAHGSIFARGGVWVIVTVVGGAAVLMLQGQ